jgi:hypothetical protein
VRDGKFSQATSRKNAEATHEIKLRKSILLEEPRDCSVATLLRPLAPSAFKKTFAVRVRARGAANVQRKKVINFSTLARFHVGKIVSSVRSLRQIFWIDESSSASHLPVAFGKTVNPERDRL